MALSDMILFNKQVQLVAIETIAQAVSKFNEASNGALILGDEQHIGDFIEEVGYKLIAGLVARRNAYANNSVSTSPINQVLDRSVKVDGRVGPIEWTSEQFARLGKSEEEAGMIIGEQAAAGMLQDYLNTGSSALVSALTNNASTVYDGTSGKISLSSLNRGASKFGDRSQALVCWLMHSTTFHDLIGEAIANTSNLFTIGNINVVQDGLGRRYVVTDSPALITSGTPDTYHTLGLVPGALQVQTGSLRSTAVDKVEQENIGKVWQGEFSYNLGLLGYAWDSENGGKSPTDTAIGTGTNWDRFVTDVKDSAGVLVNSQ